MTSIRLKFSVTIMILLFSTIFVPINVNANGSILPEIGDNTPTIDGNVTTTEWNSSVQFNDQFTFGQENMNTSILAEANSTHLFIGFNYTTTNYMAVNNTIPSFNYTKNNYTKGYSNQSHDWFALMFDNNLDDEFSLSNDRLGTSKSPDDAIVVNQYNESVYDGYSPGDKQNIFHPDQSITYNASVEDSIIGPNNDTVNLDINGTTLQGNNGTQDVNYGMVNSTDNNGITTIGYEFVKPLRGTDTNGADFNIDMSRILKLKLLYFNDLQANSTPSQQLNSIANTKWYSLRLNDTGTGIAVKSTTNTSLNLQIPQSDRDDFSAIDTALSNYGYNVEFTEGEGLNTTDYENYDLSVIKLTGEEPTEVINKLIRYLKLGGQAIIMIDETSDSINNLLQNLKISYLSNQLLIPLNETHTQSKFSVDAGGITSDLPLIDQPNPITQRTVQSVNFSSSVFNISKLQEEPSFVFGQQYMKYDLFETPSNVVYDQNDDGNATNDDDQVPSDISLGLSFDLLKGGRISILPSSSLLTNGQILEESNTEFFLRLLPWNSRSFNILEPQDTKIDKHNIKIGGAINVEFNVTDGLGNSIEPQGLSPTIKVQVIQTSHIVGSINLQHATGSVYTGSITLDQRYGFMKLHTVGSLRGYGFAEGETFSIYVKNTIEPYNDLADVNPILLAVGIISILSMAYVYRLAKNYQ